MMDTIKEQNSVSSSSSIYGEGGQLSLLAITTLISIVIAIILLTSCILIISLSSTFSIPLSTLLLIIIGYLESG